MNEDSHHVAMTKDIDTVLKRLCDMKVALERTCAQTTHSGQKTALIAERPAHSVDEFISNCEQAMIAIEELQARERHLGELNSRLEQRADELKTLCAAAERDKAYLQRANDRKSELMSKLSHELRTPLNAIMGFSELLKDGLLGELSDRQRTSAAAIFESGTQLLSLIDKAVDLSRAETTGKKAGSPAARK